jgi:starvation-inducible DNA-binding protein
MNGAPNPLYPTKNTLAEAVRARSIAVLNATLASAIDLERQAKQAHWNVRGPNFIALHELFDKLADCSCP